MLAPSVLDRLLTTLRQLAAVRRRRCVVEGSSGLDAPELRDLLLIEKALLQHKRHFKRVSLEKLYI